MIIKSIKTNKATVYLYKNGIAKKYFLESSQAKKEYDSLCKLLKMYPETTLKEWTYKSVKPLGYNGSVITMELVEGETFENLMREKPEISYHTGVWLGLFHNYTKEMGLRNIDFNRKNILVECKTKTVTVIDPGGRQFTQRITLEKSILNYIIGLVIGSIEQKTSPKNLIEMFLKGYYSVSKYNFNMNVFKKSLKSVILERFETQKHRDRKNFFSYLALHIIGILMLV